MELKPADSDLRITYTFALKNGSQKTFDLRLDAHTLALHTAPAGEPPEWTRLSFHPCDQCPLAESARHCPVAVNLSFLVSEFAGSVSHEQARVTVETPERTYVKDTTLQRGLSSIIGIVMVSSGCPSMDRLRPMVRFHLPFATTTETLFRTVSAYLVSQFLAQRRGKATDWGLDGLREIYQKVSLVNKGISQRISSASQRDANVNAVIILHSFGDSVPFFIENGLNDIEYLFEHQLQEP